MRLEKPGKSVQLLLNLQHELPFGIYYITRVLAQVDAKMIKPQPERPFEGSITIHSEISPMASSDYEPGR